MDSESVAPWIQCQEILVKAKNELILEAIDALHREIGANRVEVNGAVVKIEGKATDVDRDIFVINNLLEQEPKMRQQYGEYIAKAERGEVTDGAVVARIEELRKFLLSLTEIHMLMRFARVFTEWMVDFSGTMEINSPAEIIAKTAKRNVDRISALEFIISDKAFEKNEALSKIESLEIKTAFRMCTQ